MPANETLRVRFVQEPGTLGWIEMDVSWPLADADASSNAAGEPLTSRASVSYSYCPFSAFVRWMEAVARGVDPALLSWEDEGDDVRLGYESGQLWFENRNHKDRWIATIPADEVAATFYSAFREFVASGYDRTRYETLTRVREVFLGRLGPARTLTQMLRSFTALPGPAVERALDEIHESVTIHRRRWEPWLPRSWDSASRSTRLHILRQLMNTRDYLGGSDSCLMRIRSRAIERHVLPRWRDELARRHANDHHVKPETG